ncbi:MAG: hypothetical protein J0M05_12030 [Candidatus Kapabacteria bacterium]|nr:hypothetical protein [Candidatus Kapabacteria bacterium]
MKLQLLLPALIVLFCTLPLYGQTPKPTISYQGVMTADGTKADGTYMMVFTLYPALAEDSVIWREYHTVIVRNGLFHVELGSLINLPEAWTGKEYLGIALHGQSEFTRTKISAQGYALSARHAQTANELTQGTVVSLNGKQGHLTLTSGNGIHITENNNGWIIASENSKNNDNSPLNQGTEWLLNGNTNTNANSWLGTANNFPLIIRTNNTEKMRVQTTGNVGIGIQNPSHRLSVAKEIFISNSGGTPELRIAEATGNNVTRFITTTQSQDITYTLPSDDGDNGDILMTNGSGVLSWQSNNTWNIDGNTNANANHFLGTKNQQPLIVRTNNYERLRITALGNIGINEDEPSQKLEVGGNILIKQSGTNTGELRLQENGVGNHYTGFRAGNMPQNIVYTLPTTLPQNNQILQTNAAGQLSWVSISAGASGNAGGDLTGDYPNPSIANGVVNNNHISPSAGIAYSKLNLSNSIVNGDISSSAGIAYSKLNLSNSIVNGDISSGAGIAYSKLNLSNSIVNGDISPSAAISYSKLNVENSIDSDDLTSNSVTGPKISSNAVTTGKIADNTIQSNDIRDGDIQTVDLANNAVTTAKISSTGANSGDVLSFNGSTIVWTPQSLSTIPDGIIVDADISSSAGIAYSKINLSNSIVNSDISSSAGIAYSKINLSNSIINSDISSSAGIAYSKLNLSNSIVNSDISSSAGIAYSKINLLNSIVNNDISASAGIAYSKLNLSNSIVNGDISSSAGIVYSKLNLSNSIVNSDISASAGIAYSKLSLTNSIVSGDLTSGSVTGPKIESNAVTTGKIADNTIQSNDIRDGDIQTIDLANNAVTTAKISSTGANSGDVLSFNGSAVAWSASPKYAYLYDSKTSGTAGGAYPNADTWVVRTINTEDDPDNIVTLNANQFTLTAGTYHIRAEMPALSVNEFVAAIYNVTDNQYTLIGQTAWNTAGELYQTHSVITGRITINATKTFELRMRGKIANNSQYALGSPVIFTGVPEIYSQITIIKTQ